MSQAPRNGTRNATIKMQRNHSGLAEDAAWHFGFRLEYAMVLNVISELSSMLQASHPRVVLLEPNILVSPMPSANLE